MLCRADYGGAEAMPSSPKGMNLACPERQARYDCHKSSLPTILMHTAYRAFTALAVITVLAACTATSSPPSVRNDAALRASIDAARWAKTAAEPYKGKQDDVYFIDAKQGWYVNGSGKLYATQDGGNTWALRWEKPGTFFRTVAFVDAQHGYIGNVGTDYFPDVKDETPLYETRDGGSTWNAVTLPAVVKGLCAIDITRVKFVNHGVLAQRTMIHAAGRVGGPGNLLRSLDAGKTWTHIDLSKQVGPVLDVKFFNEQVGFVFAGSPEGLEKSNAVILKTTDGGASWKEVYRSTRPYEITWKASFPTEQIGYVTIQSYDPDKSKSQRYVAKTSDGGNTWRELPLVADHATREFGVGFVSPDVGWVGVFDGAYQTTDGGANWTKIPNEDIGKAVNKIRLIPDGEGFVAYAVGTHVSKFVIPSR